MKIACLQFAPQVGDVDNNLNRADAVLNKVNPKDLDGLDLLILPEMAFSGYNFESLSQITPFLEHAGSGISSLWARTNALKLDCNVVVGYPERVDRGDALDAYNSAIMVSSEGETIANYRKSHLYYTDERWALEGGDGFFTGYVPCLGYTAMGICMDINPYRFEAPWHAYEFAFHVLDVEANVVILSMAWLTHESPSSFSRLPQEPDVETLTYWVQRLEPVIRAEQDEEIIVIFCNRTGIEGDATYAGTSAVLGIYHGEVNLYGILGRGVKELLIVDTSEKPKAKLVNGLDAQPLSEIPMRRMISPIDSNTITEASPGNELSPGAPGNSTDPNATTPHSAAPGGWNAMGSTPISAGVTPTSPSSSKSQRVKPPSIRIPVATSLWRELPKEVSREYQEDAGAHTPTGPSPTPLELRPDGGSERPSEWLWTPSSAHVSPLRLRSGTPKSAMRARTKAAFGLTTPDTPSTQKVPSSAKSTTSSIWQELAVALCTPPEESFVSGITDTPGIMDTPGMNFPAPLSGKPTHNAHPRSIGGSRVRSASTNEHTLHHPPTSSGLAWTKDRATGIEHASPIIRPMSTDPIPHRHSSPKSRNTSRSRAVARSDSVKPILGKSDRSLTPMQRLEALVANIDAERASFSKAPEKGRDGSHKRHHSQETRNRNLEKDFSYPKSAFPRSDAPEQPFKFPPVARLDLRGLNSPNASLIPLIASPSIFSTTSMATSQASMKTAGHKFESRRSESRQSDASRSRIVRPEGQGSKHHSSKRSTTRERDVKAPPIIGEQRHLRDGSVSTAETAWASSRHQVSNAHSTTTTSFGGGVDSKSKSAVRDLKEASLAQARSSKPLPALPVEHPSQPRAPSRGRQHGSPQHHNIGTFQFPGHNAQHQAPDDETTLRKSRKHNRSASMGDGSTPLTRQPGIRSKSRPTPTLQPNTLTPDPNDILATISRVRNDSPAHREKRSRSSNANAPGDVHHISLRVQLPAPEPPRKTLGQGTISSGRAATEARSGGGPPTPKALFAPGGGFGGVIGSERVVERFMAGKPTTVRA